MNGPKWREWLIAGMVLGGLGLIWSGMLVRPGRGMSGETIVAVYVFAMRLIGGGIALLVLALALGLVFAFLPGLIGRRRRVRAVVDARFVTVEDHVVWDGAPALGAPRVRLRPFGPRRPASEFAATEVAYRRAATGLVGWATVDGGLLVDFEPDLGA